jgi:hypothetical protein
MFMLAFCCFGSPITVPDSSQGEAWFTGYVDTVPGSGGYDYLLGWSFEVVIDYRLSGWDGVTPLYISTTGPECQYLGLETNCVANWSGPINPDGVGILIANDQLTSIFDFNGTEGVGWGGEFWGDGDRWSGYWFGGDIAGPVTGIGMFATPEPSAAATMVLGLGVLLWIWRRHAPPQAGANRHRSTRLSVTPPCPSSVFTSVVAAVRRTFDLSSSVSCPAGTAVKRGTLELDTPAGA